MGYYLFKIAITTTLVVLISEIAKRSSLFAAVLASIPLVSVLAIIWLYVETKNIDKISQLSISVFWLVIPSLALFIVLPVLLKQGLHFYLSMSLSILVTVSCYWLMLITLGYFNIKL